MTNNPWPVLVLEDWQDTLASCICGPDVGKIRLARTPLVNHWWNSTLYISARGLTTSAMSTRIASLNLVRLCRSQVVIECSDGATRFSNCVRKLSRLLRTRDGHARRLDIDVGFGRCRSSAQPDYVLMKTRRTRHRCRVCNQYWRALVNIDECSRSFARASSASAARSIFGGAALIMQ